MENEMSKTMHTRVISFTYFSGDLPTFESQEAMDSWLHTIGRMVVFGLQSPDAPEDTVQVVKSYLSKDPVELMNVYYKVLPATEFKNKDGYPVYYKGDREKLAGVVEELADKSKAKGNPFVMSAVQSSTTGKFNLHS